MSKSTNVFESPSRLRCRPGDLAILNNSRFAENLGCVLEILEAAVPVNGDFVWRVLVRGRAVRTTNWDTGLESGYRKGIIHAPDKDMTPIAGSPDQGSVETDNGLFAETRDA